MRILRRAASLLLRPDAAKLHSAPCWKEAVRVHPAVSQAVAENRPVVALESTIITHGMPYPHNLSTAQKVEDVVRAEGVTPATVAVMDGELRVGLTPEELRQLAQSRHTLKVSTRDLPYALSQRLCGGTTVSATMIAAHRAGVRLFVTGGIGGVHRDGENSLDVSADLMELSRTPVAVVSAGVKSILDVGRTLEFLETQGVCVATYGSSRSFPAFFSPNSGFFSPCNVSDPQEAAQLILSSLSLGLQRGLLLALPIPEQHAGAGQQIEEAIQTALTEARCGGISGKDVTPFLLQRVNELTEGQSLQANIALILNNAKVGSQVARALSEKVKGRRLKRSHDGQPSTSTKSDVVVVGGINMDFIAKGKTKTLQFGQTNPGTVCQSFGGVGRNIADSLSRLGHRPLFISAIGADSHSHAVLNYCSHMDMRGVVRLDGHNTATYCAVISESGELSLGLGDMDVHQCVSPQLVSQFEEDLSTATLLCVDGNIPSSTIGYICSLAAQHNLSVWFEPTDTDKACKPFLSDAWKSLSYCSPNLAELCSINRALGLSTPEERPQSLEDLLDVTIALCRPLLEHLHCLLVTLGAEGLLVCGEHRGGRVNLQPRSSRGGRQLCALHYPALTVTQEETVNVSGAGDSLAAAVMSGILQGKDVDCCIRMGLLSAKTSLSSPHPVSPSLNSSCVDPSTVPAHTWPKPTFIWIHPK